MRRNLQYFRFALCAAGAALAVAAGPAAAQHLWWDVKGLNNATCLYGEITVLATHHAIYYCGANWHPGEPAGGYCGIQHNGPQERRTIFSIWDTAPTLHPRVTQADPATVFNRFGGEGEGAHTHLRWNWTTGEVFRFFLRKQPGTATDTTAARYYFFDRDAQRWRHGATIVSPNGNQKSKASVAYIGGGGLASFLENFGGRERQMPKLALYRLWLGTDVGVMKCLTRAQGDGLWGQLHDAFFLAEGDRKALDTLFDQWQREYGKPIFGSGKQKLRTLSSKPVPPEVIKAFRALPQAPEVREQ